ncbi:MAG TPA: TldD/PmbA family protein [Solirubrobacteraceae bacterium]|jgi:TldD protein|nr:TldD/PmbA family protein [Solirubrobacteraceae bacterium]
MADHAPSDGILHLLTEAIAAAPAHCSYAEARHVATDSENVLVRNGRVDHVDSDRVAGIGVRVRAGGGWGFAATRELTAAAVEEALGRALAIAESQPTAPAGPLAPVQPARGHWCCGYEQDPFAVSLEDKLELLLAAEAALRGDARIVRSEAECTSRRVRAAFASTEGAACTQERVECGASIAVIAVAGDELQVRSYPSSHGGSGACAGWEHVLAFDLVGNAPRVGAEAIELLTAPVCPAGRATIVLDGDQLALQIHESIGHALELDRMLLGEAAYAGTSWVSAGDLGALRYGSELLYITADATLPGGLGSFGWDDEGVAAARTPLIEAGVLRAALSDRQSAAQIGLERSGGCARADGFSRQPIVRMTNVSIEPGAAGTLNDLIADTGEGLYLETNRSWSIDDRRLQFQFGTEVAREIRGGELGRLLRNASYAGVTPRFWGSLDAICSVSEWRLRGLGNCGKGEPGQLMRVSHGAAPARFRDVEVGVA